MNEKSRKYIMKYRATYWATNQIGELGMEGDDGEESKKDGPENQNEGEDQEAKSEEGGESEDEMPVKAFIPKKAKVNDELSNSEYGEEAPSEDSEVLEYEPEVPKIKYKVISLQMADCPPDKWKLLKFDCKKTKALGHMLIDMVSRK